MLLFNQPIGFDVDMIVYVCEWMCVWLSCMFQYIINYFVFISFGFLFYFWLVVYIFDSIEINASLDYMLPIYNNK